MSGNGVDLGTVVTMLVQVIASQGEMRDELRVQGRRLDEQGRRLDEHGRRISDLTAEVREMRAALDDYHRSVVGHGVLISELDERVTRLERRGPAPEAA